MSSYAKYNHVFNFKLNASDSKMQITQVSLAEKIRFLIKKLKKEKKKKKFGPHISARELPAYKMPRQALLDEETKLKNR